MRPTKIISGAQTGADQAGLDAALLLGIAVGGYIPRGCRTELGNQPELKKKYNLIETASSDYPTRTRMNAQTAHGTVWFGKIGSPGYKCTKNACKNAWIENPDIPQLQDFVHEHQIHTLNVAGNRESTNPGLHDKVVELIYKAFRK